MRRTRLGVLILAAGWACFPIALVARSVVPAFLGVLLVCATLLQRPGTNLLTVRRAAPEEVVVGEPFDVVIEAEEGGAAPLFVADDEAPNLEVLETTATPGRGRARLARRVVARHPGVASWGSVRVRVQDAWGLVEEEVVLPLRDHVRVVPPGEGLHAGRHVGKKDDIGARAKRRLESDWEPEIERLRDYQPGDRLRDIDWAHSTQLGKLITREIARQSRLPVVVLIQATASMRQRRRHAKLDTAVQAGLGAMAAAQASSLPAGLVAFDDRGVRAQVRVSSSRKAIAAALRRLSELPAAQPVEDVPPPLVGEAGAPLPAERAFLEMVGRIDPRSAPGLTPLEAAIGAVGNVCAQPALVVCILDAEEAPGLVKTVVPRLARHGHRCIVAAPRSGSHHYALRDVDDDAIASLIRWRENRATAARTCRGLRVPFVSFGHRVDAELVRKVIASAR